MPVKPDRRYPNLFRISVVDLSDPRDKICIQCQVSTTETDIHRVMQNMKSAAKYFALHTDQGQTVVRRTHGTYNWGDVIDTLPEAIQHHYGFHIEDSRIADMTLEHSENLVEG